MFGSLREGEWARDGSTLVGFGSLDIFYITIKMAINHILEARNRRTLVPIRLHVVNCELEIEIR